MTFGTLVSTFCTGFASDIVCLSDERRTRAYEEVWDFILLSGESLEDLLHGDIFKEQARMDFLRESLGMTVYNNDLALYVDDKQVIRDTVYDFFAILVCLKLGSLDIIEQRGWFSEVMDIVDDYVENNTWSTNEPNLRIINMGFPSDFNIGDNPDDFNMNGYPEDISMSEAAWVVAQLLIHHVEIPGTHGAYPFYGRHLFFHEDGVW